MLFDVAAVLVTSVALGPAVEAFSVPSPAPQAVLGSGIPLGPIPDAPPLPFIGPGSSGAQFAQGTRLLQQLSLRSATSIPGFVAQNPGFGDRVLAAPPSPTSVTAWWSGLNDQRRTALTTADPGLVGNLEGIPYSVRDTANRALLNDTMAQLTATLRSDAGRTSLDQAGQQLNMLRSIRDALGSATDRSLITLDVNGQGRAAIVLGDLRTADYVTYLVPGMFFTIANQIGDWTDAAARLGDEQRAWLEYFAQQPTDESVATIAWIGYPTPNLTNVGGIDNAYEGRDALASAIQGLQAMRAADQPYLSVVAHSYGSTAALMALTEYDFEIDALALVGSPGSPAKSVDELNVRGGNVFVGEAAWDPVPNSSYFGSDPGAPEYGAKRMSVQGGLDALTGVALAGSAGHNEYFSPGTQSMRNFALIGIGKGQYVTDASLQAKATSR